MRYDYADGSSEAHQLAPDHWPVIREFRDAGKLSYCSEEALEGMAEIFRLGLDR